MGLSLIIAGAELKRMPKLLSGRDLLYLLVRKFLANEIGISVFCTDFENCYNFQTNTPH